MLIVSTMYNNQGNRIYNKILDRDWFSVRLFVTQSARDHVDVQLQVSDLNQRRLDTARKASCLVALANHERSLIYRGQEINMAGF